MLMIILHFFAHSTQHQQQVAAAVERAKQVTTGELNAIIGVSNINSDFCDTIDEQLHTCTWAPSLCLPLPHSSFFFLPNISLPFTHTHTLWMYSSTSRITMQQLEWQESLHHFFLLPSRGVFPHPLKSWHHMLLQLLFPHQLPPVHQLITLHLIQDTPLVVR